MEFKVEYKYTKDWIPPRCRKPRPGTFEGEITVSVDEVTSEEAPVVALVNEQRYCGNDPRNEVIEIRSHDGKFYVLAKDSYVGPCRTACESVERLGEILRGDDYLHYLSERKVIASIRDEASHWLIVDGEVWYECGEPRYEIVTFGLGHNHGGTSWFVEYCYNSNLSWRAYFNANDFERMVESFFDTALGRGDTNDAHRCAMELADGSYREGRYIEVIDPSVFKCDPRCEHGDGDPFMNRIYDMTQGAGSAFEAGLLVMASALREVG